MTDPEISVIIPVYNEENRIQSTLRSLKSDDVKELIVVDGGSTDQTIEIAKKEGAKVVQSDQKKRSVQLNLGAKVATSNILYFIHADTIPPDDFSQSITHHIQSGAGYGCFTLQFDDSHPILRFYAAFTKFRTPFVRFGDQSLFVKKALFESVSGFDEELTVMEDQEIYRRLRRVGRFELIKNKSVITSARKYLRYGVIKLQLIFLAIWLGYYFGVQQKTLVHLYKWCIRTE